MKKFLFLVFIVFTTAAVAQDKKNSSDSRFHDDLLDHLQGTWKVNSVAHGFASTGTIKGAWVLNHQFFYLHFMGTDTIPWWQLPMEYVEYFGYNSRAKRYTIHGMSIEGDADPSDGFSYGYRDGNTLKTVAKAGGDTLMIQRLIWEPASRTWSIQSTASIDGKERSEIFLEMKLEAVNAPSKK